MKWNILSLFNQILYLLNSIDYKFAITTTFGLSIFESMIFICQYFIMYLKRR